MMHKLHVKKRSLCKATAAAFAVLTRSQGFLSLLKNYSLVMKAARR
jgi:hypothetical protein